MHREEAFNLLHHLWTFQPTYVQLSDRDLVNRIQEDTVSSTVDAESSPKQKKGKEELGGRWGLAMDMAEEREVSNVKVGEQSIQKMLEIREINASTLAKMEQQAESLDRTQHHISEAANYTKQGSRTLDGVGSTVGQVKNFVTPNLHKGGVGAFDKTDRGVNQNLSCVFGLS